MDSGRLIAIVGTTASGKTGLAIELAKKFDGEIICADSRTVYKELDIGTAKPSVDQRSEAPHHLLDIVSPDEAFTVADFKKLALRAINDIRLRGKLPIVAGGSGLYIDALIYDFEFSQPNAERDKVNPRHLSKDVPKRRRNLSQQTLIIGLDVKRSDLRFRVEQRVEQMIKDGLIDEVKQVSLKYPNSKALEAPGYRAFIKYVNKEINLTEAKEFFLNKDMSLAKRQMTWFTRNPDIQWISSRSEAEKMVEQFLKTPLKI